jgi:integrase
MKNYLPMYKRKAGDPKGISKIQLVKQTLPEEDLKLLKSYLIEKAVTNQKQKVDYFERVLIQFRDILERPFNKMDKDDLLNYCSIINQNVKSNNSRTWTFYIVRDFLKSNGFELWQKVKNKRSVSKQNNNISKNDLITSDELARILRVADSLKIKALITLQYESGARPDEIRNLKWRDINIYDDGHAEVKLFSSKKQEGRTILVKDCVVHLRRWKAEYSFPDLKESDFVFIIDNKDKGLSRETYYKLVRKLGIKAGIQRPIFPYLFRHTRLSYMRQRLKAPHYVQYSGHSERQAQSYTHLDTEDLKQALLSEIYPTEEIEESKKHELQLRIDKQNQDLERLQKEINSFKELRDKVNNLLISKGIIK